RHAGNSEVSARTALQGALNSDSRNLATAPPASRPAAGPSTWYRITRPGPSSAGCLAVPTPQPLEQRLLGRTLAGRYRLVAVQAAGGFGTVFRAEQLFCGRPVRPVAVKVSRQAGLTEET